MEAFIKEAKSNCRVRFTNHTPQKKSDTMQEMRLNVFYNDFYVPLKLRSASIRTCDLYRTTIRNFCKFLKRPAILADLNDDTVGRFLGYLRLERKLAAHTVNKDLGNVLAMWRFACRKNFVSIWPDVPPEPEPEIVPKAWTQEELVQLYKSLRRQKGMVGNVPESIFWPALLMLAWDTGERIGAIMAVTRECIDLKDGWVTFRAETRKGGRVERVLQVGPDTRKAIKAVLDCHDEACVFHWPKARTYLWDRYGALLKKAGLPNDRRCKFHMIRRSTATHYEAIGGDATELLGHSSRAITMAYLDPRLLPKQTAPDKLFRLGGDEKKAG